MRTKLVKLIDRVAYYEWAYGHLGESDADIGPVGEFLVGKILKCLPKARSVNALLDLEMKKGGRTFGIEVKTTTRRVEKPDRKVEYYEWNVTTQRASLEGKRELAPVWVFLAADFPKRQAAGRFFDPFDERYWTAWVATGEQIRSAKVRNRVSEATLRRLGVEPRPLVELKARVSEAIKGLRG